MWQYRHKPRIKDVLDRNHPLTTGMTDCLFFNESGGVPTNLIAKASTSTFTGAPTWRNTQAGQGLYMTGVNYANIPDHGNIAAGDFSIRVVHKPNSYTGTYNPIFDKSGGGVFELAIFIDSSGNLSYGRIGNGNGGLSIATGMTTGQVWDFVVTRLGSTVSFYVNGLLIGTASFTGVIGAPTQPMALGGNPSGGGNANYDGDYILLQIWNRALPITAIARAYANPYEIVKTNTAKFGMSIAGVASTYKSLLSILGVG